MRPGGIIVEVVSFYDSRHVPMTGIFPRLSGIIGLHHYTHFIDGSGVYAPYPGFTLIKPDEFVKEIVRFRRIAWGL